ncbi:MAG: Na+/H+ antiporter NhaA [Bacteroidota bacterium]
MTFAKNTFLKWSSYFPSTGVFLLLVTVVSLVLSNTTFSDAYIQYWNVRRFAFSGHDFNYLLLINDFLMAIFFLNVGLEIKRELVIGELSSFKKSITPIFAAIGGMIVPASIYYLLNLHSPLCKGWGIPMATDIAFAVAILALAGKKMPAGLKLFLMSLAIIDDLGAVIVIALFYTQQLFFSFLLYALVIFCLMLTMNLMKIKNTLFYLALGLIAWYFILCSGVHATIAGVVTAFFIPLKEENGIGSPLERLQNKLNIPVDYFILPLFAMANTAMKLQFASYGELFNMATLGVCCGLVLGKPIGIYYATKLVVTTKIGQLPEGCDYTKIAGAGMLGGIGFTMSIFILTLAFPNHELQTAIKCAVLLSSFIMGVAGFFLLRKSNSKS